MILNDGKVKDFKLNTQCSAGNGYFLQSTAQDFGVKVEDYAQTAFSAKSMPEFGYGCAVFMQSDIVDFQRQGWKKEEIMAGLANVLPKNIWLYVSQIPNLSKDMFRDRVAEVQSQTQGKLIIKEYPTGQAHTSHFRALLNELKLKKNFVPEMIFVDYLNICASSRMKGMGGAINSYTYIKSIAEELRGLAVEFNVPIVSATQTTRSGYSNDDVGLEDTSESFGLPATADLMFALIANEELNNMGKMLVKQLKNRYNDPTTNSRFTIRVDRSKMRLSDDDQQDQDGISSDDTPVFDKSDSGKRFKDFKME